MRGNFGEITSPPEWVDGLINDLEKQGVFERGIESDRKQRGSSINVDAYGYDQETGLAVIQIRQCVFHPRRFNDVRKNYFLIGHNESGSLFSHAIDSPARSSRAMRDPEDTVRWVLCQIWGCTERQLTRITRQGDVGFLPEKIRGPNVQYFGQRVSIRDTHLIDASEVWFDADLDRLWAVNPVSHHIRDQHRPISLDGFYRVILGYRAETWNFSRPILD